MYHHQIQCTVILTVLLGKTLRYRLLVQCMEHTGSGKLRNAGISGDGFQLVNYHGIYDIRRCTDGIPDLSRQNTAQIGSVLSLLTDLQIFQKVIADCIGTARDRL